VTCVLYMYTENSAHVHCVHTNNAVSVLCMNTDNAVSVLCMNTDDSGSIPRKHTSNSTSVICVLTTNSNSVHYVNSNNITMSGERGLQLCLVNSIRVPGWTEFINSTSKLRLYFNKRQARKKIQK
jgi:hypothetical protein